jgi:mono/diheme cytochrome c family protein
MTIRTLLPMALVSLGVVFATAPAQAVGNAAQGHKLAQQWCASCHMVDAGQPTTDTTPSFLTLAKKNKPNSNWARLWLMDPHPPMKGIDLSRHQIDDVVAYLQSLPVK